MRVFLAFSRSIKTFFSIAGILYCLVYLPLSIAIYVPHWYQINTAQYSSSKDAWVQAAVDNITKYFLHLENLHPHIGSYKEILHMQDIRAIYDVLFVMLCVALVICLLFVRKKTLKSISSNNAFYCYFIFIVAIATTIVTSYKPVWAFLHKISFNNNYYIYAKNDISAVLFPHAFFQHSILLILVSFIGFLWIIRMLLKRAEK